MSNSNNNLKYFEKNKAESHLNIFKSLEMENYLKQILKKHFGVFNIKLNFSSTSLTLFLFTYKKRTTKKKKKKRPCKKEIVKSLTKFTNNKFNINLKIKNLEKFAEAPALMQDFSKKFEIFDLNQTYESLSKKPNTADLLGILVTKQLEITKQHNFFLSSLKRSLTFFLVGSNNSRIKGIKILIKGRLNNAPRSQNRILRIGRVPITSQSTKIEYSEMTAYTANGTIGTKIWLNVKNLTKMFLQPKKYKYKKTKKGKLANLEFKKNKLKFGTVGLRAVGSAIITARHIEAARQAISRKIKKKGKIWIRIFPDLPVTAKSVASRMGKGKGNLSHWGARVKKGSLLFEICGVKDYKIVKSALRTGGAKLPTKTKISK